MILPVDFSLDPNDILLFRDIFTVSLSLLPIARYLSSFFIEDFTS